MMRQTTKTGAALLALLILGMVAQAVHGNEGAVGLDALVVEPEHRCVPYEAKKYPYPSDMDQRHVEARNYAVVGKGRLDGAFPSPYTAGTSFRWLQDMDIEHIVAKSEAHDSGMCSRPDEWRAFSSDPLNLTVASEHVNRTLKRGKDAAEWMPDINRCWFASTVVAVKAKWGLSVDRAEHDALKAVLDSCK